MGFKLLGRTIFPALVSATSPLTLLKVGLAYTFGLDISALRTSLDPIYAPINSAPIAKAPGVFNAAIIESHAANAVTFALRTIAGAVPSAADPVTVAFPDGAGGCTVRTITAAVSLTISAGSTLGVLASSSQTRLAIVFCDNAGTVVLGAGNFPLVPRFDTTTNTAAEGGVGGADSSEILYSSAGLTGVYVQPFAYATYGTIATPGNWTATPVLSLYSSDRSSMSVEYSWRPEVTAYDVAMIRPKLTNRIGALDVGPSGAPAAAGDGMIAWIDNNSVDLIANPGAPVNCGRIAVTGTGDTMIGNYNYNGAVAGKILFQMSSGTLDPFAQMSQAAVQFKVGKGTDIATFNASPLYLTNLGQTTAVLRNSTSHVELFLAADSTQTFIGSSTAHDLVLRTSNTNRATLVDATGVLAGLPGLTRTGGVFLEGTNTNDSASAGRLGEYISSSIVAGSAVAMTTGTPLNVTSISLTAGDWDVTAQAYMLLAASTSLTNFQYSISGTSATLDVNPGRWINYSTPATVFGNVNLTFGSLAFRISLAGTTTVYLVGQGAFSVAGASTWGFIGARRAR